MMIELKKFGTTLLSRQAGREAWAAFQATLQNIDAQETLEIDFRGVLTFSPSWGDEFLTPLLERLGDRLILQHVENLSVKATLEILEQILKKKFKVA